MRILFVDDDDNKVAQVQSFVLESFPSHELAVARSYQSGLKQIIVNRPDAILLDMTMPTYDVDSREPGGRERRYAGREVLRQMQRRRIIVPTIVITQYEQFEEKGRDVTLAELGQSLKDEYPEFLCGSVYYQAGTSDWMKELHSQLLAIVGANE